MLGLIGKQYNANLKRKILKQKHSYVYSTIKDIKNLNAGGVPIYEQILPKIVKEDAKIFYKELSNLNKHLPATFVDELIKIAVKKDLFYTTRALRKIKEWKIAKRILKIMTDNLEGDQVFRYMFPDLSQMPWINKFFSEVCKKEWSYLIFKHAPGMHLENPENIYKSAIDDVKGKNTKYVFKNAFMFQSFKSAEEILTKAVNIDSEYFFKYFNKIKNQKWAKKLAITAAKQYPGMAILYMKSFKDVPYLKEIIDVISKSTDNLNFGVFIDKQFFQNVNRFIKSKSTKNKIDAKRKEAESIRDQMIGKIQSESGFTKGLKKRTIQLFCKDKAIQKVLSVKEKWIGSPYLKSKFKRTQFRVAIARNLFYQNLKISEKNVREMYFQILKQRAKYSKLPLFRGRNVVYVANNEKNFLFGNLFGEDSVQNFIKQQCGKKNFSFIRAENNRITKLLKAKRKALKLIETKPKLTLVLDGHGSSQAVFLTHGGLSDPGLKGAAPIDYSISYHDVAKSLRKRAKRFPNEKPPILILSSCFSSVFVRNLYAELNKTRTPLPVVLGSSAYGQIAKMKLRVWNKINSGLFKKLKLGKTKTSTFQDIFDNEEMDMNNPTISIPTKDNKQMQIGRRMDASSLRRKV